MLGNFQDTFNLRYEFRFSKRVGTVLKPDPILLLEKFVKENVQWKSHRVAWNRCYHHPRHFADESRVLFARKNSCKLEKPAGKQGFAQTFLIVLARWIQPRPKLAPLAVCTVCCVPFLTVWGKGRGGKKAPLTFSNEQMGKSSVYKGSNWTPKVAWNAIRNCIVHGKLERN